MAGSGSRNFDDVLEEYGIYENGEPSSRVEPLFNSAGTERVGWLWESVDIASEWIGPDGANTTYWNAVRLVLPKPGVIVCGYSFEYEEVDYPDKLYFAWDVFWRQTRKKAIHREPLDHVGRPFRSYDVDRIGGLVNSSHRVTPWFVFDLSVAYRNRITLMEDWLRAPLERMAKPTRTQPKDRNADRCLLRAIDALDPNGLAKAIRTLTSQRPDLRDPLRQMIPTAYHTAIDIEDGLTVRQLAEGRTVSESQVLRRAKELSCTPLVGRNGRHIYAAKDARRITENLH